MQTNQLLQQIWASGDYIGERRPVTRVSVQQGKMYLKAFSLVAANSPIDASPSGTKDVVVGQVADPKKQRKVRNYYASYLFNNPNTPLELPNVKSFSWQRSVDQDAASATLELWNVAPLGVGVSPGTAGGLDSRGWYTPWRGGDRPWNPWGVKVSPWSKLLVPDNIVRTYQGYGSEWLGRDVTHPLPDDYVPPEADGNLLPTGVWIIDRVSVSEGGGMITVTMRDVGRLFLDHMVFTPVVPSSFYPLRFKGWAKDLQIGWTNPTIKKVKITPIHHSNEPWYDGLQHPIFGHRFKDAFDGQPDTYWLSVGNVESTRRFAYEWIEVDTHKAEVTEVRFRAKKKGYTAYISVMQGGEWQGTNKLNYHEDGIGQNGADIHYVKSTVVNTEDEIRVKLPKVYKDAQRVRLTFSNLQNFGVGTYHYRAGIREMTVYGQTGTRKPLKRKPGPEGANPGYYRDYGNIVALVAAWAGLYQPKGGWVKWCDGTIHHLKNRNDDEILGHGVGGSFWGDRQPSGTVGPNELGTSLFDKRMLMDVVNYVKDVLGFQFFVDPYGRFQFRMPNFYKYGSWVRDTNGTLHYRDNRLFGINDDQTIMDLDVNFSSENLREGIFVANTEGKFASYVGGYNPNYTGLRRVAGYSDTHFGDEKETRQMAEMIAVRQMYSYRSDTVTIPGNPCLEIDDQVRIMARVTGEGYIHYVKGISSQYDADTGQWTYSLETFWLGDKTAKRTSLFNKLPAAVQRYIIGVETEGTIR